MVNYIKSRPFKPQLFAKLCTEMGSQHLNLTLHTEILWLSKRRLLTPLYEFKEEMIAFFYLEKKQEFHDLLQDDT
jgi:hypothetical protein